ncbi:MAG: aminotransferase class IV, partial [Candidatus Omnitrophica bacterium]|nr:aminotransferase class IV [Candidatus Omnitrophota bacterium]
MKIYLNNKFLEVSKTEAEIFNSGLFRGYGVFESMRALDGKIVYLNLHLARFFKSARVLRLEIPYTIKYLESIIRKTLRLNKFPDAYVKLAAFAGAQKANLTVLVKKYQPYPPEKYKRGFKVKAYLLKANLDPKFTQAKTLSRALFETAYQQAKAQGFDEALLLNNNGYLIEGTRTNIFLVKGNKIYTPALKYGCLAGVTRKAVLGLAKNQGIAVIENSLKEKDILASDEI